MKKMRIFFSDKVLIEDYIIRLLQEYIKEGDLEKLIEARESIDSEIRNKIDYDRWKKERRNELSKIRKEREKNASGSWDSITKARYILFLREKDGNICPGCNTEMSDPTLDHIIPLTRGGDNSIDNLRLLCRSCNSQKGSLTWEEFIEKQKKRSIINEIRYLSMNKFGPKKISQILNIKIRQASSLLNDEKPAFSLNDLSSFLEKIKETIESLSVPSSGQKEDILSTVPRHSL